MRFESINYYKSIRAVLILTACLLLNLFGTPKLSAQISVSGGSGLTPTYTSLTNVGGLFAAINATPQTGNTIVVSITGDMTTEAGTNSLNAGAWISITISPSGGARTISGTVAGSLINLNGADNVVINGLGLLTITNTNTSGSTIKFILDATNNIIQNCTILGSGTSAAGGTIFFSTATSTGNDNNTITACTISAAGANLPANAIYSLGTVAKDNNNITISNNNIQDYFKSNGGSNGIYVASNSSAWNITGNRFFQTSTPRQTNFNGSYTHRAININTTNGGGYIINNNIIGYRNSSGTLTTDYTVSDISLMNTMFYGIELTASSSVSTIQGNTIASITLITKGNFTSAPGIFSGIYVKAGSVNIRNNTIGATTGINSISITSNTSVPPAFFSGIYAVSADNVTIQDNKIGAINTVVPAVGIGYNFDGIHCKGAGNFTISDNLIGSAATTNSIIIGNSTSEDCKFNGIFNEATGTISITSNTIKNCSGNPATNGIWIEYKVPPTTSLTISNNSISNLISNSGSVIGIQNDGESNTTNIVHNTIGALTAKTEIIGIKISNTSNTSPMDISSNIIHTLEASGGDNPNIFGVFASSPSIVNVQHNTFHTISTGGTFKGISLVLAGTFNINSNTIGDISPNNIILSGDNVNYGIYSVSTGNLTCNSNVIQRFDLTNPGANKGFHGIYIVNGINTLQNDIIRDIDMATTSTSPDPSLTGINIASPAGGQTISKCEVKNLHHLTTTAPVKVYGIYANGIGSGIIEKCMISELSNASNVGGAANSGIYLNTASSYNLSNNVVLANNPQSQLTGIYVNCTTATTAYHNSIHISGSGGTQNSACLYKNGSGTLTVKNNIFKNERTGGSGTNYAVQVNNTGGTFDRNYLQTTSGNPIAFWTVDKDLAGWNAITEVADDITGTITLNSFGYSNDNTIRGQGALGTGVTDDIDGNNPRSSSAIPEGPWLGAWETTRLIDVGATLLVSPTNTTCAGNNKTVSVQIRNYGSYPINLSQKNITVHATILDPNGSPTFLISTLNAGTFAANSTLTVTFPGTYNMSLPGTYAFGATTSIADDINTTNDAMPTTTVIVPNPFSAVAGEWIWTGVIDQNWFNGANWDPASVPTLANPVIIPGGTTNQPRISGADGDCLRIRINTCANGQLDIDASGGRHLNVVQ